MLLICLTGLTAKTLGTQKLPLNSWTEQRYYYQGRVLWQTQIQTVEIS